MGFSHSDVAPAQEGHVVVGLLDTGHHFKNLVLQVEMIIQPIKSDIQPSMSEPCPFYRSFLFLSIL